MTAIALTIAGSDCSGGAGIQADLKTFSALGVYGASALTALTAQNTKGVRSVMEVDPAFVRAQIDAVCDDLDVAAIKIGMLAGRPVVEAVGAALARCPAIPVVLDPVMVATSGDRLISPGAAQAIIDILFARASVITPNLHEAASLTGEPVAQSREDMKRQAGALRKMGASHVCLKGGHGTGSCADDLLDGPDGTHWLTAPRLETANTHGTGCTLSSAIAAGLACGLGLEQAAREAKSYIQGALGAADTLSIGQGAGPVHHFFKMWKAQGRPSSRAPSALPPGSHHV